MTTTVTKLYADTYIDSVVALRSMRAMKEVDGVEWATAIMATPANIADLADAGVTDPAVTGAGANDFCLAVTAESDDAAQAALAAGADAAFATREVTSAQETRPRTVRSAVREFPDTNVAVISVAGEYATLAAYQALDAGMHVLLFSDNVPVADEIALKEYAVSRGLLLMGPDAGTAMLGGVGLGFANVVTPGRVGIVAAAGTGAQEAMALLDRWGVGVSHVIGTGGRDLHADVGGLMATAGVGALRDDPATEIILLVSKPPAEEVARTVLAAAGDKPIVAALLGMDAADAPGAAIIAGTLEAGVLKTLEALGADAPDHTNLLGPSVAEARDRLGADRRLIRGLYSGGTLCYEAQIILGDVVGPIYSNGPIRKEYALPAPADSHQCIDLGADEYTHNRPHPMIDPQARIEVLRDHAADGHVGVIILDVVLGYGSHPDPAGELAPVCAQIMADGGPQVVAYVLGTDGDPQGYEQQRAAMAKAGCIVAETNARACLVAAALVSGDDSLMGKVLA